VSIAATLESDQHQIYRCGAVFDTNMGLEHEPE